MAALTNDPSVKWSLQSDLLYELMTYGDGHERQWADAGNWNNERSYGPRAVLTWLAMCAFDIKRLPWLHDRVFTKTMPTEWEAFLIPLRDQVRREAAVKELHAVHDHVVAKLRQYELDPLVLSRGVDDEHEDAIFGRLEDGYATRIAKAACAAARLGREEFAVPIDVLSSWSLGGYSRKVIFTCALPATWIGWSSRFIASRHRDCSQDAVEGGEWVVACRDLEGTLRIPTTGVVTSASFRAENADRHRPRPTLTPGQQRRLEQLRIDPSFHSRSDEQAEELLAATARAYGPMTSGHVDKKFHAPGKVDMDWQERLGQAIHVLWRGRPK